MLEVFNEIEALEIGLNLEKDGIDFYTAAAAATEDSQLIQMYLKMADDEKEHYARFASRRKELMQGDYQENADMSSYLKLLVNMGIFAPRGDQAEKVKDITNPREVITLAIQAEKDALLFFHEAAASCKNEGGQKLFRWLLSEEKHHLKVLGEILEKLKKG